MSLSHKSLWLVVLIGLQVWIPNTNAQDLMTGKSAPDWTLHDGLNQSVSFPNDFQGQPVVILFWATWCPYCARLMPYLEEIQKDYADHRVTVLALNFKEDHDDPVAHVKERGLNLKVLLEADSVAKDYGIRFSPGLLVVDGQGQVVYQRHSTDQPPGNAIAKYWANQVRSALDESLGL